MAKTKEKKNEIEAGEYVIIRNTKANGKFVKIGDVVDLNKKDANFFVNIKRAVPFESDEQAQEYRDNEEARIKHRDERIATGDAKRAEKQEADAEKEAELKEAKEAKKLVDAAKAKFAEHEENIGDATVKEAEPLIAEIEDAEYLRFLITFDGRKGIIEAATERLDEIAKADAAAALAGADDRTEEEKAADAKALEEAAAADKKD